jgi:stage II sporulation protein M
MKKIIPKKTLIVLASYILGYAFGSIWAKSQNLKLTLNPHHLKASDIISHNMFVIGIMAIGILTAGIVTLIVLFINGATLGITIQSFSQTPYLKEVVYTLLPHGIVEIPSFLIAGIGDIYLAVWIIKFFLKNQTIKTLGTQYLKRGLLLNVTALILIIAAGFIEAYVVPHNI